MKYRSSMDEWIITLILKLSFEKSSVSAWYLLEIAATISFLEIVRTIFCTISPICFLIQYKKAFLFQFSLLGTRFFHFHDHELSAVSPIIFEYHVQKPAMRKKIIKIPYSLVLTYVNIHHVDNTFKMRYILKAYRLHYQNHNLPNHIKSTKCYFYGFRCKFYDRKILPWR